MRAKFLILFLSIGPALFGADFTIVTGETVTATQTLASAGDVGIIEEGGTINVNGALGVEMETGSHQTLLNAGTIATTGDSFDGVLSSSASAIIASSGTILTSGNNSIGIIALATSAQVANSGTISTVGTAAFGIESAETLAQIANSGTISTIGASAQGIFSTGTSAQIVNSGVISTGGGTAFGIDSTAASVKIVNSGTISTGGNASPGISCTADFADVENSGIISTTGTTAKGIGVVSSSCRIINNGVISTTNTLAIGIGCDGDSCLTINNGMISTTGSTAAGVNMSGTFSQLTNSGTISTTGPTADGILCQAVSGVVINSGTVSTTGTGAVGISATETSAQVINSGTIKSAQSDALAFTGTNPTLTLLLGSNLQGTVTSTHALNLNVEEGLNLRLTIEETNGFGTLNIGSPFITVGNTETVAVVDPTGFAMQADILEDLSDSVLDNIYRSKYDYLHCQALHCDVWMEAIGTSRSRKQTISYTNWEDGGLAGVNWEAFCCGTLGVFAGGTYGQATVGQNTQRAKVATALAGLSYEQMYNNIFVGFAMTGGYVNWRNRRTVLFNLAPGGEQAAKADISGWMISPELTASAWLGLSRKWSLLGTGTLRYAGLFLGSYDESGSGSDLSVSDRQVDLLKVIGELAFSAVGTHGCNAWNFEPYIGLAGRFQVGGRDVSTELLGQTLDFDQSSSYDLLEVLFGIRGQQNWGRYTLYGNIEGLVDNFGSERVLGELGLRTLF